MNIQYDKWLKYCFELYKPDFLYKDQRLTNDGCIAHKNNYN